MKKYKKILLLTITIIFVLILYLLLNKNKKFEEAKIELDPNYNELFTQEELNLKGHENIINKFSSDVSIGFNNKDGTKTLYVYASPIRYVNKNNHLSLIDTRIKNVSNNSIMRKKGYIYTITNSDIEPFFPKELSQKCGIIIKKDIEYEFGPYNEKVIYPNYQKVINFIGEQKNMLIYKNAFGKNVDLKTYPSSLGCNCEIHFNKKPESNNILLRFKILDDDIYVKKEPGGYLTIVKDVMDESGKKTTDILGVIQKPLMKNENNEFSYNNELEFASKGNGLYELELSLDKSFLEKNTTAFIAFEIRREKQPDNALYSNFPKLEYAYLRNYSVIGNKEDYGIGRLMIRYKFAKYFNLQSSQIKKANYYTYSLTNNCGKYELLSVLEDWCSLTGNWSKNYKTGDRTSLLNPISNELKFNITDEVKKWCDDTDGQMEHNGVMLKSVDEKEGVFDVILSNDNSLYKTKTEVILD